MLMTGFQVVWKDWTPTYDLPFTRFSNSFTRVQQLARCGCTYKEDRTSKGATTWTILVIALIRAKGKVGTVRESLLRR